jgi:hypothetical protein
MTKRYNVSEIGQRVIALSRQAARLMQNTADRERVAAMHERAGNYDEVPCNEEERALLASSGAMAVHAVLSMLLAKGQKEQEEIAHRQYLAHVIRAVYTVGVLRGREEGARTEANTGDTQPLIDTLKDL